MVRKQICVIGGGKWGQNHIETLFKMGNLGGIADFNKDTMERLLLKYPVKGFNSVDEAIDHDFDGFVVATPAQTHYFIGKTLLENGCNALIEKPLTLSSKDSKELIGIAQKNDTKLMVGHLLLFHPAIRKIKEIIDEDRIGILYYIYSHRLNLGTVRTEENVLWSFAPHDISVINFLIGYPVKNVYARGAEYLQKHIYDMVNIHLTYHYNVHAHIFISWLHPFKEQRLVIIGSKGMISFDDSSGEKNLLFYNKRIDWHQGIPVKVEEPVEIIEYQKSPPLWNELNYFLENLNGKIEIADGKSGHEVVRILEKAQNCLDKEKPSNDKS